MEVDPAKICANLLRLASGVADAVGVRSRKLVAQRGMQFICHRILAVVGTTASVGERTHGQVQIVVVLSAYRGRECRITRFVTGEFLDVRCIEDCF